MASNNSSEVESLPLESISCGVKVVVLALGCLSCVSGILGNILILSTLMSYKVLRSQHNMYVGNLAVADLLVIGYFVPHWLLDVLLGYQPVVNAVHCQANAFIMTTSFMVSVYTLVMIGLDRYISVCHNALYVTVVTKSRTAFTCVLLWLASAAISALPFFQVGNTRFYYNRILHFCIYDTSNPLSLGFIRNMVNLILPAICIGIFSLGILNFWKKSRNRIDRWTSGREQNVSVRNRISQSDVALVRSLVLVFAVLIVLYIPFASGTLISKMVPVSADTFSILSFLLFLNHSINWMVYGLMNKHFKDGYKRQLRLCMKRQTTSDTGEKTRVTMTMADESTI